MADFNTVDTSGFDAAISAFNKAMETYSECRDQFSRQSTTLIGKWQGVAGEQYKTSYNNIQRSLTDNLESLKYIIENLETVRQTYHDWDAETKATIQNS